MVTYSQILSKFQSFLLQTPVDKLNRLRLTPNNEASFMEMEAEDLVEELVDDLVANGFGFLLRRLKPATRTQVAFNLGCSQNEQANDLDWILFTSIEVGIEQFLTLNEVSMDMIHSELKIRGTANRNLVGMEIVISGMDELLMRLTIPQLVELIEYHFGPPEKKNWKKNDVIFYTIDSILKNRPKRKLVSQYDEKTFIDFKTPAKKLRFSSFMGDDLDSPSQHTRSKDPIEWDH